MPSKKTFLRTKVVVMEDIAAFELVLVPVVKGTEAVVQKTGGKSAAVAVEMTMHKKSTLVGAAARGESAAAIEERMTLYLIPMLVQTGGKERLMPPYWCVKHGPSEDANMARDEVDVDALVQVISSDERRSSARPSNFNNARFTVPVMTITKALLAGTELVFLKVETWPPKIVAGRRDKRVQTRMYKVRVKHCGRWLSPWLRETCILSPPGFCILQRSGDIKLLELHSLRGVVQVRMLHERCQKESTQSHKHQGIITTARTTLGS